MSDDWGNDADQYEYEWPDNDGGNNDGWDD